MDLRLIMESIQKFLFLPQRLLVCILGFLAVVNAFVMRHSADIKLTIRPIVARKQKPQILHRFKERLHFNTPERYSCGDYHRKRIQQRCRGTEPVVKLVDKLSPQMWSAGQVRTLIMVAFYIGYVITHIPGAFFAERYGGKRILAVALTFTILLALLTSFAVSYYGVKGLIVIRLLMGLSEGPLFPALSCLVPVRGCFSLAAVILNGGHIAMLLVNLISGVLLPYFEWSLIFYFFGACVLLWFISFLVFCFNDSESNPYIEESESRYLEHSITSTATLSTSLQLQIMSRSWGAILTSPPKWAFVLSTLQHDWTQSLMLAELCNFVDELRESDVWYIFCSCLQMLVPFFMNWLVLILSGILSDILVQRNILNANEAMKFVTLLATYVPRICSDFAACILSNERNNLRTIFKCTMAVMGTYYVGTKLTYLDMNPNYVGVIMTVANGLGSLTNIISPYMDNLTGEEGPLQNMRSFIWLLCTLFTSDENQVFPTFGHNITTFSM